MFDFLKIKSNIGELTHQLKKLADEIEKLKRRREDLQTLPLPREELCNQLCVMVDAKAAKYPNSLAKALEGLIHKPFYNFANSRMDLTINYGGGGVAGVVPEANRCWYHGEEYKNRLRDAVMVMDYPDKVGPPLSERKPAIDKLDKEILKLEQQEETLRQQAEAAGIHIGRVDPIAPGANRYSGGRPLHTNSDQERKQDRRAQARLRKSAKGKALGDMSEDEIVASGRFVRVDGGWASKNE